MIYRYPLGKPSQTEKALLDDQPAPKSFTIQLLHCKYLSLYHASKFTNLTTTESVNFAIIAFIVEVSRVNKYVPN